MAVQGDNEGSGSTTALATASRTSSINAHSEPLLELKEICSSGNDHTLKVRKPYTITKQREKWTDEEHQRFLEALKLYGRGWRQIEEHVGTKTAVQIRSHAQKFFSKVARESNSGTDGSVKPIEIPPPRPKRKPMHPYPRKSVDTLKGTSVAIQLGISSSTKPLATEKGRQSPTSVLSAVGSDALGSAMTENNGGCQSPMSCTTDMHLNNSVVAEKENESPTSKSPAQKEKESFAFLQLSAPPPPEILSLVKLNSTSKGVGSTAQDGASVTDLKLFGATLKVAESQESHPSAEQNDLLSLVTGEDDDKDTKKPTETHPSNKLDTQLSLGMIYKNLNAVPRIAPTINSMEQEGNSIPSAVNCGAYLPRWTLYQSQQSFNPSSHSESSAQKPLRPSAERITKEIDILKERSCTGSNSGSVTEVDSEKNPDAVDSQSQQSHFEGKTDIFKNTKGFVPYKRCLAERDLKSSASDLEERKAQRVRVCS